MADSRDEKIIDDLVGSIYKKFRSEKNQAKGTWLNLTPLELTGLLMGELSEFFDAVINEDYDATMLEAADVGIYLAMLADVVKQKNTKTV